MLHYGAFNATSIELGEHLDAVGEAIPQMYSIYRYPPPLRDA